MRLINVKTTQLVQFFGGNIPNYAILSHTWGKDEDELTIQDLNARANIDATNRQGPGWAKLEGLCKQAAADGLDFVWLDTCCIDKTNSTELGEAINSMFRWYQKADICYAYLSDVDKIQEFEHSRWFTRGWTLQELLAPRFVRFYDSHWNILGTKRELAAEITDVTGIPKPFLLGIVPLREASVAQRMCWASRRETKRIEDTAYCLLGIFGFNMPMIYGEEKMAFIRLQEEIMRHIRDDSILAWQADPIEGDKDAIPVGALATSPAAFAFSGDIIPGDRHSASSIEPLHMQGGTVVVRRPFRHFPQELYLVLDCHRKDSPAMRLGIPICASSPSETYAKIYTRLAAPNLMHSSDMPVGESTQAIRIHATRGHVPPSVASWRPPRIYVDNPFERQLKLVNVSPLKAWDQETDMITAQMVTGDTSGEILMRFETNRESDYNFIVALEIIRLQSNPLQLKHHVMICHKTTELSDISKKLFCDLRDEARGAHFAHNGTMGLQVTIHHELVGRQMMFVMRFSQRTDTPNSPRPLTVDVSNEIHHHSQEQKLISLLAQDKDHASIILDTTAAVESLSIAHTKDQEKLSGVLGAIAELESQKAVLESQKAELEKSLDDIGDRLQTSRMTFEQESEARMKLADNLNSVCSELSGSSTPTLPGVSTMPDWTASIARRLLSNIGQAGIREIDEVVDVKSRLLLQAAGQGWVAVVCLLVGYGCNINTTDRRGKTLLAYARAANSKELVNYLIEHGATDVYRGPVDLLAELPPVASRSATVSPRTATVPSRSIPTRPKGEQSRSVQGNSLLEERIRTPYHFSSSGRAASRPETSTSGATQLNMRKNERVDAEHEPLDEEEKLARVLKELEKITFSFT